MSTENQPQQPQTVIVKSKRGGKGCLIALAVVGLIVVAGVAGVYFFRDQLINSAISKTAEVLEDNAGEIAKTGMRLQVEELRREGKTAEADALESEIADAVAAIEAQADASKAIREDIESSPKRSKGEIMKEFANREKKAMEQSQAIRDAAMKRVTATNKESIVELLDSQKTTIKETLDAQKSTIEELLESHRETLDEASGLTRETLKDVQSSEIETFLEVQQDQVEMMLEMQKDMVETFLNL